MRRVLTAGVGVLALAFAAGCSKEKDKPEIPTEIKQPPGPDTEGGNGKKKPADGRGQKESKDG